MFPNPSNMKKRLSTLLFFLLVSFIVLFGCSKEKKAINRIHAYWHIKSYTVDGIDSLNLLTNSIGNTFHFYYQKYYASEVFEISNLDLSSSNFGCYYFLGDDAKTIHITDASGNKYTGPFRSGNAPVWEIIKLTNSEFSMKTTYNNKEYFIELQ